MLQQIKDLCLFMICGQTLLYFQSGKKYEKICRMILELLVLAGIVGMILNLIQSLGIQRGEMEAAGGAVAGMQRSMEEALSKQLGADELKGDFLSDDSLQILVEKYTKEEIKTRYNYFAKQYGLEIVDVKQQEKKIQVFLKETDEKDETNERADEGTTENTAKIEDVRKIEIEEIELREDESSSRNGEKEEPGFESDRMGKAELETFRRQLALVFAMEESELEVILID